MQAIEITCRYCGMTGNQVREVRANGLDLGAERIAAIPDAPCCHTTYVRDLNEVLADLESAIAKRLKPRYLYLALQEA
jgi:hypothetical protein